jgi:hypothetical protein
MPVKKTNRSMSLFAAVVFASAVPACAHHSYAVFDASKKLALNGTAAQFQWTNPHSWLRLAVPGAGGKVTIWDLELGSPVGNANLGWRPKDNTRGDKLSVVINPRRDGSAGGGLVSVTLADGRTLHAR